MQQTLRELKKSKPKDQIFLTLEQNSEYNEFYKFSFNIPPDADCVNQKVIKEAVKNIESLRRAKKQAEESRNQKMFEEKIAKEREAELGRLIVNLQIGKITPEEFKKSSDAIYNNQ